MEVTRSRIVCWGSPETSKVQATRKRAPLALAKPKGLAGPEGAHLDGLDWEARVIHRARRGGEMNDIVEGALHVEVLRNVVLDEAEGLGPEEVGDVVRVPRDQVVEQITSSPTWSSRSQR